MPNGSRIQYYTGGIVKEKHNSINSSTKPKVVQETLWKPTSTHRSSYKDYSRSTHRASFGGARRYSSSQQPWAVGCLGHVKAGISPQDYQSSIQKHISCLGRPQSAPARLRIKPKRTLQEEIVTLTGGDELAKEAVEDFLKSASYVEKLTVDQLLRAVSRHVQQTREQKNEVTSRAKTPNKL
eukprot:gene3957-6420_t